MRVMPRHPRPLSSAGLPNAETRRAARIVTISTMVLIAFGSLVGCGTVKVFPSSTGFKAEPKPADCQVDFLLRPPQAPYDEIAEVARYLPYVEVLDVYPNGTEPQDVLREKSCELGADAVIVTRDTPIPHLEGPDGKLVAGVAIKYRDGAGTPPRPSGP